MPADPLQDSDTLDMAGDWQIVFGYTADGPQVKDESGHHAPRGYPSNIQTYKLHFDLLGKGSHGGNRYKGIYVDNPLITLEAETYYDRRGVQVMHMAAFHKGYQAVELHTGAHVRYADDPTGVHVVGNWCSCGGFLGDKSAVGNPNIKCEFVMKKVRGAAKKKGPAGRAAVTNAG